MVTSTHELVSSIAVIAWLCAIAWFDIRQRRIPNDALFAMLVITLVITAWRGVGILGVPTLDALKGFGLAAVVVIPSYAMRGLGAGDAKLLMVAGCLLGVARVIPAMLIAAIALGAITAFAAGWNFFRGEKLEKLPAAVPIGIGVASVVAFPSAMVLVL